MVRGTHLGVQAILLDDWRWSDLGDGIVELCGVDVGTKLVEDWVSFRVGDLSEWELERLLSL